MHSGIIPDVRISYSPLRYTLLTLQLMAKKQLKNKRELTVTSKSHMRNLACNALRDFHQRIAASPSIRIQHRGARKKGAESAVMTRQMRRGCETPLILVASDEVAAMQLQFDCSLCSVAVISWACLESGEKKNENRVARGQQQKNGLKIGEKWSQNMV